MRHQLGQLDRLRPAMKGWAPALTWVLRPLQPAFETARHYDLFKLRKDLGAGLTVSVVEVPQSMAYALLAGVPPQYGLYTSVIQGVIGALLSSSEHMTTGPTNTQSLLIASAVMRLANPTSDPATYLRLVFALTLLKGIIQLCFAAARLGRVLRFVSRSVIVGLASGAGVLIVLTQFPRYLGIVAPRDEHRFAGAIGEAEQWLRHLGEANPKAIAVGTISLAIVLAVRVVSKMLPAALMGMIAGGVTVAAMGWTASDLGLVGELPRGFPTFNLPSASWAEVQALLGGALALALIGMIESVAIAKSIAAHTAERISANQEFFAQGLKNAMSSFFQCIPGSGSFTRSALDYAAGAQTRFAAVYNAMFVAIIFWGAGTWTKFIPLASLGAVLVVVGCGLIDWRYIPRTLRVSRADAAVCGMTFAATIVLPLEFAVFAGILLSVALHLRAASRLHMTEVIQRPGSMFSERDVPDGNAGENQIVFLQLEGDLFFGVADELRDRFDELLGGSAAVVILRLKRTHSIDVTVLAVLDRFAADLKIRHRQLLLCGVKPNLMNVLRSYGIIKTIGEPNVFAASDGVFTSAKMALARGRKLLRHSDQDTHDKVEEAPSYVI